MKRKMQIRVLFGYVDMTPDLPTDLSKRDDLTIIVEPLRELASDTFG